MAKRISFSEMQAFNTDQLGFMARMADELGHVAHIKTVGIEMFFISEPSMIRELLVKQHDKLQRDPFTSTTFKRFMGESVFIAEGQQWRKQRKLVQPAFHAMRIRAYADTMSRYTLDMVEQWQDGDVLAIGRELTQLTLRIIAKTMYDVDLVEQVAEIGRLMQSLSQAVETQLKTVGSTFIPTWVPTASNRQLQRALDGIQAILAEIIAKRKADGRDHGDLLSMLLAVRDENGAPMSDQQILDECVTLFFAGHETTTAALVWAIKLLMEHPAVVAELRDEIAACVGNRPIQFEPLAQMPLLEAVVKETMRLYPPAFGFGRRVVEPFTVADTHFPKRAVLMFNTFALHRRADLFPDPLSFKPERFLEPAAQPDRYAYMPFGAGSRICLGNMFAMMEAQLILGTLVQHVTFNRIDASPVELDTVVTLRPKHPLMVQLRQSAIVI